ncbi:MAG: hypothetical protein KF795_23380 [Labilithrix sp.]|nr:hypothetical protein [Labilithrix sp.]
MSTEPPPPSLRETPPGRDAIEVVVGRHLRAGWWSLAAFVALGAVLELFHAIKSPVYVDAGRETTRLLLRLAHAHGTLLSLLNVAYALTVRARVHAARPLASASLLASLVLLPGGFLLGGIWARGGDPGLGVLLVPAGAVALLVGAIVVGRGVSRRE